MAQNYRANYYSNPAFCQQSEFYQPSPQSRPTTANLSRCSSMREAPIGANASSPHKSERPQIHRYESVEMDENEIEINNKVISELRMEEMQISKTRYSNPVFLERNVSTRRTVQPRPKVQHRYATIPSDEDVDDYDDEVDNHEHQIREMSPERVRYSSVPSAYLGISPPRTRTQVDYNGNSPQQPPRYPIPAPRTQIPSKPTTPKKFNPVATQKLYELITTPKKSPQRSNSVMITPQKSTPIKISTPKRAMSPPPMYQGCVSPVRNTPPRLNYSQSRQPPSAIISPKAQQHLNYNLPQKFNITSNPMDSRTTAVIAPIYSQTPQSVYSETTFSAKSNSWTNISAKFRENSNATLAVAALMMILCGALTSGVCLYMISLIGRKYYLDFGLVSGFTCFVLGLLGFRTRTCRWLPNRNYISGYIMLSVFSLLTSAALLVLLGLRPKPGSPLADITSGAVCGISALSMLLAMLGVLSSYCCKYPPPDNRVEHCAPGFTV